MIASTHTIVDEQRDRVTVPSERSAFAAALAAFRKAPTYDGSELLLSFLDSPDPHVALVIAAIVINLEQRTPEADERVLGWLDDAEQYLRSTDAREAKPS